MRGKLDVSRREFLKRTTTTAVLVAGSDILSLSMLRPASAAVNPLAHYPNRDWERLYRDLYAHDDSFVFMCTPNCTHNCYLRAYVKNGVVTRCGPTQRYHDATDVYGTKASQRWDPRHCNKGLAVVRRFNGDRRVKGHTDLPLLVRMDTHELLRAADVIPDYRLSKLERTRILDPGETVPPSATDQQYPAVSADKRQEWGDFAVWDGAQRDVNGRKSVTLGWTPLALDATVQANVRH